MIWDTEPRLGALLQVADAAWCDNMGINGDQERAINGQVRWGAVACGQQIAWHVPKTHNTSQQRHGPLHGVKCCCGECCCSRMVWACRWCPPSCAAWWAKGLVQGTLSSASTCAPGPLQTTRARRLCQKQAAWTSTWVGCLLVS